ncbi:MAG: hypothetical protein H0U49_10195 [Parachlamydiaceae bacterium]|nr:hypothetical protein [Parachlamydiaceae bacterium]
MNSDYIIRIIEQFIQATVAIVRARKAGNYEEAFHQIQNASQRYLHTDITSIINKTPEQLLDFFKSGGKHIDAEQCMVCADLLYETALICESKQFEDLSLHSKISCLHLYLHAIPKEKQFQTQSYMERVDELIKELENKAIPKSVKEGISIYQKLLNKGL